MWVIVGVFVPVFAIYLAIMAMIIYNTVKESIK